MENLAQTALDSALKHGADFADIRFENAKITFIEITDGTSKRSSSGQLKGVGVRAFLNGAWAFAHTTNLTQSGMRDIGIRVARTAKVTSEHVKNRFEIKGDSFHGKVKLNFTRPLEDVSISEKMSYVKKVDQQIREYDSRIVNSRVLYRDLYRHLYVANSFGTQVWMETSLPRLLTIPTAKDGPVRQRAYGSIAGRGGFEILEEESALQIGTISAKKAVELLSSKAAKGGTYDVILNPELNGAMVHEAFGHPCEADNWVAETTILEGKFGKKVGPDILNLSDDPTIPNWRGTYEFDWEGTKTRKRKLVTDGVLTELLHNLETASRLDMQANGAARAQSFMYQPIPRMSNTFMESGDWGTDELIADTREGILLNGMNYGYTSSAKGQFMFQANHGYLIENGEKQQLIRDVSIAGQILDFLNKIDAIGKDFGMESGTCGKAGQLIPDYSGGPHARIRQVPVGGM